MTYPRPRSFEETTTTTPSSRNAQHNALEMRSREGRLSELRGASYIMQLQAMLYLVRDVRFDDIYQDVSDNRRMKTSMEDLERTWGELNEIAEGHEPEHPMHQMRRDGHCHEAVMWYVHHLTQDINN